MMDCLHSMAPKDDDLVRYTLDGEPLPAWAEEHLTQCKSCQQRLHRYIQTNTSLLTKLYRSQCPSATTLSDYCTGTLLIDDVFHISDHLKICPLCAKEVADMRWMLADTELFPPVETALTPKALVRRIMATLVPGQLQLVTRNEASEAKAQRWPRQYRADDINLSLHLSRDGNGDTILLGLITSADEEACIEAFEGTKVALYYEPAHDLSHNDGATADVHSEEHLNIAAEIGAHEEGLLQSTQVDDLGNIIFKGVPVGAYHMIVYLPENELVIEGLDIHQG